MKDALTSALQWWQRQRVARALARYGAGNGGQLSGGIALTGLISIAAALTIGLSATVGVFRRHPDFRDVVFDEIDTLLPGVIDTGDGGMISPEALVESGGWSIAGIIGGLVLLNTATGVMKSLRVSLRAMFGMHSAAENFAFAKLRDFGAFLGLALSVLVTSALSIIGRSAFEWIQSTIGHLGIVPDTRFVLEGMTLLIGLLVDGAIFIMLFRGLAGARVPWSQMWQGALLGAVGTGALRFLGASVVTNVAKNPLLASVAAVATLLLWLNIAARVTLMVAAWTADPPAVPKLTKDMLPHHDHTPNYVSVSAPETLKWEYGVYTALVQPLSPPAGTFDATEAAAEAKEQRRERAQQRKQDEETGVIEQVVQEQVEEFTGPPPLVRIAPDSPLGKLINKNKE